MTSGSSATDQAMAEVGAAADSLVAAFGSHDTDAYFAAFDADATFMFHTTPRLLRSRAEYELEWASWEADGFHVDSCEGSDRQIDLVTPDIAVMTHRVRTRLAGVDEVQRERETIVFRRTPDNGWRAVHEHLSPDPQGNA